ncbi:Serine/threonine-protein kinase [Rhizoctonia solani]|uniref:Serine/threonine-protein kinase n=1 Tax=Rhizoctonia solani TaxID=456999 RepID=A0A8H8NPP3_9AGAM|nr:Serine/threonine-protein kinase [Rhizoctonia solani]QRW16037.1 Serine/threonine-protein kinase [Rhizoctonia solani]
MFRPTQSSLLDQKMAGGRRTTRDGLVSPPDTESISSNLGSYATPQRRPSQPENLLPTIPATPDMHESAGARFRRFAGIPSSQSGSREFRGASRPQTRWLVVLLPPDNLIKELSVGHRSPGKLSSGLLVPLFPTLFAQLTAIAKEFSLPSTTGLCLYLHLPDAPETPRITDDVWPLLWARHLHTDDASLPLGLPVAGRVQFDIDIPSARWYPMWFTHVSRKELVPDLARTIPASPRSPRSPRGVTSTPTDAARVQKVPRPLALVPRQESAPQVQIDSGPSPVPSPSKVEAVPVANKETVEKVRRWSALVTPEPAALQQNPPTEEPASLPNEDSNVLPTGSIVVEEAETVLEPLNLEDFQWSITSAGPPSPVSSCATTASSRVPSIHLLERVEGSVILTPTTATSWGPRYDSDAEIELEPGVEWNVRSPDLGERAEGSVLLTPSTATSWGPLSYPPTPAQWAAMHELVRSPDLGERAEGSVLLTPSTATTWGAPSSYPPTPSEWRALTEHIVRTPDLARRAEGSVLLTPSTATTWGPPSTYPETPEIARPREWVPSPGLGDRELLTPGQVGRLSTMNWGTTVETEEEAYARMGLSWPDGTVLSGIQEEADEESEGEREDEHDNGSEDEDENENGDGYEQTESLEDVQIASVQRAVRSVRDSVLVQITQEVHYDDTPSVAGSNDDVESLYDGHTFGQEDEPERAFEFELELESPQLAIVAEEHHDAIMVESSQVQEVHASHGLIVEDYDFRADTTHDQVEINFNEGLEFVSEGVSVSLDGPASGVSMVGDVFEYAFPDSRAEPAFPISVSTSEFPLSPAIDLDSPMLPPFTSETREETITITTTTIEVNAITTVSTPRLLFRPKATAHIRTSSYIPPCTLTSIYILVPLRPSSHARRWVYPPNPNIQLHLRSPIAQLTLPALPLRVANQASASMCPQAARVRVPSSLSTQPTSGPWTGRGRYLPYRRSRAVGSLGSVREVLAEEAVVFEEDGDVKDELSVPSQNSRPQPLSTAYPYRYPENLEQLYPPKDATLYPTSLGCIYPALKKKARATSSITAHSVGTKASTLNNSPATYSTQPYPIFDLYPAVYPHNLRNIYPALPQASLVPKVQASTVKASTVPPITLVTPRIVSSVQSAPAHQAEDVTMSRGYPFIEIYPAVYPYNLTGLYPPILKEVTALESIPVQVEQAQTLAAPRAIGFASSAPTSSRDGYPLNLENIYPAIPGRSEPSLSTPSTTLPLAAPTPEIEARATESLWLARTYPNLELYRPVYPYNLIIYPPIGIIHEPEATRVVQNEVAGDSPVSDENLDIGNDDNKVLPKKTRKTHAQLCTEVWRKTHAQLVAEVTALRPRKSHAELEAEVFPGGLPEAKFVPQAEPSTPTLSVTEIHSEESKPVAKPVLEQLVPVSAPAPVPKSAPAPAPAVAALRRQRSGTIMRSSPTESLPSPSPSQDAGVDLGRSRSMVEVRTKMLERAPARSQTGGPQESPARTLVRQKSASFERAKSLFHTPEETKPEGSQTPSVRSVPMRRVTKLDMSKFGFA